MSFHIVSDTKLIPENKMIADNEVIQLEHVSVRYRVPQEQIGTFREYFIRFLERKISYRTFFALKDTSFSVKKGEIFGIIGNNGAGKSTLMKVIARVLKPNQGRVIIRGKVAPLLELGAGFHPELTGRENIYLNGSILGYSRKEMDAIYNNIVEFSELGDFINAPIRNYSSGMDARLGFSVATAYEPEVLLVDEVLSVGDEAFQIKCMKRINQFKDKGTSILIVSHSLDTLENMCHRIVWLDHGKIQMEGDPKDVISNYRKSDKYTHAL
jgi:ABC-2 type transport system ATP-binding protein